MTRKWQDKPTLPVPHFQWNPSKQMAPNYAYNQQEQMQRQNYMQQQQLQTFYPHFFRPQAPLQQQQIHHNHQNHHTNHHHQHDGNYPVNFHQFNNVGTNNSFNPPKYFSTNFQ